jgi:hypothetical protein
MSMEKSRGSLDSVLRELAQDDARHGTSVDVQARLLSEVRSIAARRRSRLYRAIALTVVAASVVGVLIVIPRSTPPGSPPIASPAPGLREVATAFLPLPGATASPAEAYIVRLELPRAALVSFGLDQTETLISSRSANTVLADLLVGEDGLARAVRFVHQE